MTTHLSTKPRPDHLQAIPVAQTDRITPNLNDYTSFPEPYDTPEESALEYDTRRLINQERLVRGLTPLAFNNSLNKAARTQTVDLDYHGSNLSHIGSDGSTAQERANRYGYTGYAGENAYGAAWFTVTAGSQPVSSWMNSSKGHREAILWPWVRELGTGIAGGFGTGVFGVNSTTYPIFLNNDALTTTTRLVTVTLTPPNVNSTTGIGESGWRYAISHSSVFSPTSWTTMPVNLGSFSNADSLNPAAPRVITYTKAISQSWLLPPGIGEQAVYVQYRSPNGTVFLSRDTILVQPTRPLKSRGQ